MNQLKFITVVLLVFLTTPFCFSQNHHKSFSNYIELATNYNDNANDSAMIYIEKAKKINQNLLSPLEKVKLIETEGAYYDIVMGDFEKAIPYYLKALKIAEINKLSYAKELYHTLGVVFHLSDNYKKAEFYYAKSNELAKKENDSVLIAKTLANLGSINSSLKNYSKSEALFLESLKYPSKPSIRKTTYSNLGNLKIREKKYAEALNYLNEFLKINDTINKYIVDYSYILDVKKELKNYDGLDTLLPKCIKLYNETSDLRDKTIMLKSLGNIYDNMGNQKEAIVYKDQYIIAYDSLKAMQNLEQINDLETKYQTEKKEEEIKKQQKEKEKLRLFFILALIAIALLSYLVYLNFKQKNKLAKQKQLLETAVDEKNILLKETHHRVKNSFQIVSSLLYLQSENMKDKEAALAVKEAQNRVKSMVLIHQKLYSKDQLIGIDTKEYIDDLVNDIIENQTDTIPNLTTNVTVESTVFSIDSITPLGLIINELITNCIKHAFNSSVQNPKIILDFKKQNDYFLLKVNDNGIGFSNEISENSFGLKLISALAKKLKGKISFENNKGTHFVMEIHKFEEM
jgi:two-component system, sensor histidine kinase PdtaS